jgi:hypothetical protein
MCPFSDLLAGDPLLMNHACLQQTLVGEADGGS